MKKTTSIIIGLSFFVWVLLIVVGVLFIHYNSAVSGAKKVMEIEIATSVRDIVRKSGQPVYAMGMTHAGSDFVLTCGFKHPITGNLRESIGEILTPVIKGFYERFTNTDSIQNLIISVRIPHRYSDGYKEWVPIVSFEFSKDEYKSIIWKRFDPKTLLRFSENVQWDGLKERLRNDLKQMRDHIGSTKKTIT